MKNKKLTYVLLPLVILLWGLIFYRIYDRVHRDGVPEKINSLPVFQQGKDTATHQFTIQANYRDPFIVRHTEKNTIKQPEQPEITNRKVSLLRNQRPIQQVRWPEITFGGLILNEGSDKKTALLSVNRQNFLLCQGEEREGIRLEKLYSDSINVAYQGEKKSILKTTGQIVNQLP